MYHGPADGSMGPYQSKSGEAQVSPTRPDLISHWCDPIVTETNTTLTHINTHPASKSTDDLTQDGWD